MTAFLNRVFKRENANAKKSVGQTAAAEQPTGPRYSDGWLRPAVAPEEVQELLRGCTNEMKARGRELEHDRKSRSTEHVNSRSAFAV